MNCADDASSSCNPIYDKLRGNQERRILKVGKNFGWDKNFP